MALLEVENLQTRFRTPEGVNRAVAGCVFASRCPYATELCRELAPALAPKAPGHVAACHYARREALAA